MVKTFIDPRKFFDRQIGIVKLAITPTLAENIVHHSFNIYSGGFFKRTASRFAGIGKTYDVPAARRKDPMELYCSLILGFGILCTG